MHHGGILEKRAYFLEHSIYILLAFGSSSFVHANEKKIIIVTAIHSNYSCYSYFKQISNHNNTLKIVSNHCHISTCVCVI